MKTDFELETPIGSEMKIVHAFIRIETNKPYKPYVVIETPSGVNFFIQDKDLKRFASNLQKALNTQ
jgi:hypothetical protein